MRTEAEEWGGQGMRSHMLLLELPLLLFVLSLCFSILVLNKGNWRKFKDMRPRLRVDLACWPCSSSPRLSFREAQSGPSVLSMWPVSLHEMAVLRIRAALNDCQMSPADWQAATGPVVCLLLEGGHNVWLDRWQILNAGLREKHFLGHFFLLTLPGSEGRGAYIVTESTVPFQLFSGLHTHGRRLLELCTKLQFGLSAACCSLRGHTCHCFLMLTLAEFTCLDSCAGDSPASCLASLSIPVIAHIGSLLIIRSLPFSSFLYSYKCEEHLRLVMIREALSWPFRSYSGLEWLIWRCTSKLFLELCFIIIHSYICRNNRNYEIKMK